MPLVPLEFMHTYNIGLFGELKEVYFLHMNDTGRTMDAFHSDFEYD